MIYVYGTEIRIIKEDNYKFNSLDNVRKYNKVYFSSGNDVKSSTTEIGVIFTIADIKILLASSGFSSVHETSYLIIEDSLYVCVGDSIFSININDFSLNWVRKADDISCFQIFYFNNKLIVHGELNISCFETYGNKKWNFTARDIFVTLDGSNDFYISDSKIHVKDWDNNEYILNVDGQLIGY